MSPQEQEFREGIGSDKFNRLAREKLGIGPEWCWFKASWKGKDMHLELSRPFWSPEGIRHWGNETRVCVLFDAELEGAE